MRCGKVLLLIVISIGLVALNATTGCGTGQIGFRDIVADLPTAEDPGDDGTPTIPAGGSGTSAGTLSIDLVFPLAGSRGAAMATNISATFAKAMNPGSLAGSFIVVPSGAVPSVSAPLSKAISGPMFSQSIAGNVSYDEDTKTATFDPENKLIDCHIYDVTITTDAKSADGDSLAEPYTWQFLSSCPGVLLIDLAGADDRGYAIDISSSGKMYVAGFVKTGDYSYAPWIDRRDVTAGFGDSEWDNLTGSHDGYMLRNMTDPGAPWSGEPTFDPNGIAAIYDETSGNVFTGGWENSTWQMMSWLQALDANGAGLLDDGALDNQGISLYDPGNPSRNIACGGMAKSPVTGNLAVTCFHKSGSDTASYLWIIAPDGTPVGYGAFGDNWGDNSMFRNADFDSDGNLYITLSPHYYITNLNGSDYMRVIKFSADQLDDNPMAAPTTVATYTLGMTAGTDLAVVKEGGSLFYYVSGYIVESRIPNANALLVKFNSQGNVVWEHKHTDLATLTDMFNGVTHYDGHVYVTGYEGRETTGTIWYEPERRNMIWKKITEAGAVVAQDSFVLGLHGTDDSSEGHDIFIDANAYGEVYIVGSIYNGGVRGIDIAVWRMDNDCDDTPYCQDPEYMGSEECSSESNCSDRMDNDLDGNIDCADSDCSSGAICELSGEQTCDDYFDNDIDGDVDCDDANCDFFHRCGGGENHGDVDAKCSDGIDNDLDGDIDCADSDCHWPDDIAPCEYAEGGTDPLHCEDGVDNDGDGLIDCGVDDALPDPDCQDYCITEVLCSDKTDNDFDGDVDCADSDCVLNAACEFPDELTCFDMLDNDADGLQDCADVDDCPPVPGGGVNPSDCEETESLCFDFFDNDGDGVWDCDKPIGILDPGDPDCKVRASCGGTENMNGDEYCNDGVDNDFDGGADCADPNGDCSETQYCIENCTNGTDDDGNELVDCNDTNDCCADAACIGHCPEVCGDEIDNDGDGDTDCEDSDCFGPSCPEVCTGGLDEDGDSVVDCQDDDCDSDPACSGGSEICDNNLDDDGDGDVDCMDADCPWQNPGDACYSDCEYSSHDTAEDFFLTYWGLEQGLACGDLLGGCCEAWYGSAFYNDGTCCQLTVACDWEMSCNGAQDYCDTLYPDGSCDMSSGSDYCSYYMWDDTYVCDGGSGCCVWQ